MKWKIHTQSDWWTNAFHFTSIHLATRFVSVVLFMCTTSVWINSIAIFVVITWMHFVQQIIWFDWFGMKMKQMRLDSSLRNVHIMSSSCEWKWNHFPTHRQQDILSGFVIKIQNKKNNSIDGGKTLYWRRSCTGSVIHITRNIYTCGVHFIDWNVNASLECTENCQYTAIRTVCAMQRAHVIWAHFNCSTVRVHWLFR